MKRLRQILGLSVILGMAVLAASAQSATSQTGSPARQVLPGFGFGPAATSISSRQHAPFSAALVEHSEQILSDGTTITRESEETVMRDDAGRIYRARKIHAAGRAEGDPRLIITLVDPINRVQYTCMPVKVCRKIKYRLPGTIRHGHGPDMSKDRNVTVDELGSSNISGVGVHGKRVTRLFPEGMIGNDRPITDVAEIWHSDDLDVDVQLKRSDPRFGTRTTSMTEINLTEPDPRFFQIPDGYHVVDANFPPQGQMSPAPAVPNPFPRMPPANQ